MSLSALAQFDKKGRVRMVVETPRGSSITIPDGNTRLRKLMTAALKIIHSVRK